MVFHDANAEFRRDGGDPQPRQDRQGNDGNRMTRDSQRGLIALARNVACALMLLAAGPALAVDEKIDPEADRKALQAFVFAKFPKVAREDFGNGPYAVNAEMRKQWLEIMQFPPYELALDEGRAEWEKPFASGKHYADCFDNRGVGVRQTYPRFIPGTGQVETLEGALNRCRVENGEKPLDPMTDMMASLTAVMAESSRGKPFAIVIPEDPRALAAYERGKEFYYSRKGQLGISCASCHNSPAGERLRGDILAPTVGITAGMPIYRSDWGSMGTTIRRIASCSAQTRAVPLNPDDEDYRDVEYFISYMSNGIPITGPGTRP
jgi:sulfur-oxidizing protein SoxA